MKNKKDKIEKFLRKGFKHLYDTKTWEYNKRLVLDDDFCLQMTDKKEGLYVDKIELTIFGRKENEIIYDVILRIMTFDETNHPMLLTDKILEKLHILKWGL